MAKKKDLAAALHGVTKNESEQKRLPPSQKGKKFLSVRVDPAVSRQLKQLSIDNDTSVSTLLHEAINDLFQKYGKPPIA